MSKEPKDRNRELNRDLAVKDLKKVLALLERFRECCDDMEDLSQEVKLGGDTFSRLRDAVVSAFNDGFGRNMTANIINAGMRPNHRESEGALRYVQLVEETGQEEKA